MIVSDTTRPDKRKSKALKMSENFFKLCKKRGLKCDYLEVDDANHYSISAHLADATSPLARAMLKQMGLAQGTAA